MASDTANETADAPAPPPPPPPPPEYAQQEAEFVQPEELIAKQEVALPAEVQAEGVTTATYDMSMSSDANTPYEVALPEQYGQSVENIETLPNQTPRGNGNSEVTPSATGGDELSAVKMLGAALGLTSILTNTQAEINISILENSVGSGTEAVMEVGNDSGGSIDEQIEKLKEIAAANENGDDLAEGFLEEMDTKNKE